MDVVRAERNSVARLASGACPLVRTTVFTAVGRTIILSVDISNPTGVITATEVWLNGVILFSIDLPAFGGVSWNGPQVIDANQTIDVLAGSVSCNFNICGSL